MSIRLFNANEPVEKVRLASVAPNRGYKYKGRIKIANSEASSKTVFSLVANASSEGVLHADCVLDSPHLVESETRFPLVFWPFSGNWRGFLLL